MYLLYSRMEVFCNYIHTLEQGIRHVWHIQCGVLQARHVICMVKDIISFRKTKQNMKVKLGFSQCKALFQHLPSDEKGAHCGTDSCSRVYHTPTSQAPGIHCALISGVSVTRSLTVQKHLGNTRAEGIYSYPMVLTPSLLSRHT